LHIYLHACAGWQRALLVDDARAKRLRPQDGEMNTARDDIATLLRLRWRLLRRTGMRGGPARNRGGSFIVGGLIVGALLLQFSVLIVGGLGALLSRGLEDPRGRAALAQALAGVSSSVSLLLFLLALPAMLALLTYSSDLKLLLLTPLRPQALLGEKLATVYGALAGPTLALGLPLLIAIGRAAGVDTPYYPLALFALLALPVLPVALSMLLTVAVLRLFPPARARAVTAVLGALLSGGVYVGSQLLINPSTYARVAGPSRLLTWAARGPWDLLPTAWPGHALGLCVGGNIGAAVAYLAAAALPTAAMAVLAVTLSARLFATGWATYHEVGRRRRKIFASGLRRPAPEPGGSGALFGAETRPARRATRWPAWWPLVGKEWRTLRRDPQVWARLLYSFVVIGFLFWQNLNRALSASPPADGGRPALLGLLSFFGLLVFLLWLPLTTLALPAINREGRSLSLLALAPVSPRGILLAKWVFCVAPSLLLAEALLLAGAVLLHLSAAEVLLGVCALVSIAVAVSGALLLVSLIWPRLDWDNPRKQVSTEASLAGGIGGLLLIGASGGLLALTLYLSDRQPLLALVAGVGLFALTGLVTLLVLLLAPARLRALLTAQR